MKKILYFLLASLCISLQSCLYQEDSYFDDSSANRATEDVERCNELLMNAPNGWKFYDRNSLRNYVRCMQRENHSVLQYSV